MAVALYNNPADIQKCWIHIQDQEPLNQIVLDHPLDKAMLENPPNETRLSLPLAQQGVCLSLKETDPSSHMLSRNTLVVYTSKDKNKLFWSHASIMDWVRASFVLPYWTKDEFEKMPQEAMETWITQLFECPLKCTVQEKDTTEEAVCDHFAPRSGMSNWVVQNARASVFACQVLQASMRASSSFTTV